MFLRKTVYAVVSVFLSSSAFANGFQISEYSATGLGRSFAGAGVVGDDFSAIAYNPAGMQYNKTNGFQGGAVAVILHADYEDRNANESASSTMGRVLPHFFTQYKLNEKLTVGAGVYTPYGLITDYKNNWSASQHGTFSGLKGVDLSVGASYQIHPMIAVGAAFNGQYAQARLTSSAPYAPGRYSYNDLQGDDIGAGYTVGLTFTPRSDTRLGISYRSKVTQKLEGDVNISGAPYAQLNGDTDIYAKITTPEMVLLSGAFDVNSAWTLSANARWTKWSRFNNLNIITKEKMNSAAGQLPAGTMISSTNENWKNTWFFSLGADYKINQNWTIRFGGAYDETVIKSPEYRTVRIPDGRRWFASFGFSYVAENWQYDVGYTHVWMRSGDAYGKDSKTASAPNIHYNDAGAYIAGASIQYKF